MYEHTINGQAEAFNVAVWAFWYAVYGAGNWVSRWECTSRDYFLLLVLSPAVWWMTFEYFLYARKCGKAAKLTNNEISRIHFLRLRDVFFECAVISFLGNFVCWFVTPYIILAVLIYHNAWRTRMLNDAKYDLLDYQLSIWKGEFTCLSPKAATQVNQEKTLETLQSTTARLHSLMDDKE